MIINIVIVVIIVVVPLSLIFPTLEAKIKNDQKRPIDCEPKDFRFLILIASYIIMTFVQVTIGRFDIERYPTNHIHFPP